MVSDDLPQYGAVSNQLRLEYLPFALIHAALAKAPLAECVISPLVADQFDALDLAAELGRADYAGTYKVIIPALPQPEIIRRELAQAASGVKVELIQRAPH